LCTIPIAIVAVFLLPRLRAEAASPFAVTLLVLAGSLWVAFTAERDARGRLDRAKRAFAVHDDVPRLLHDHLVVFLVVIFRLEVVVVGAVVTAVWGLGPAVGVWIALLGGIMMGLAWPSERKTRLLIERARKLRDD